MKAVSVPFALFMTLATSDSLAQARLGGAILKLPISVRQIGMGDLSVGQDDVLRAWSNPATLATQPTEWAAAIGGASMFGGEDTSMGLAFGWRTSPKYAIGAMASSYGASVPEIDAYGNPAGSSLQRVAIAGGLAGALRPIEWMSLGATGKVLLDRVVDDRTSVFALDAGMMFLVEGISTGVAVRNLGQDMNYRIDAGAVESALPMEFRVGAAYSYGRRMLTVGMEYMESAGVDGRVGMGLEWWPAAILALRAGMADAKAGWESGSFGLSAAYKVVVIDYAFSSHPLGVTHRASLSYAFGRMAAGGTGSSVNRDHGIEEQYQLAVVHFKAGEYELARGMTKEILAADPAHWRAWALLGNYHYKKANMEEARMAYGRSLEIYPENHRLRSWMEEIWPAPEQPASLPAAAMSASADGGEKTEVTVEFTFPAGGEERSPNRDSTDPKPAE